MGYTLEWMDDIEDIELNEDAWFFLTEELTDKMMEYRAVRWDVEVNNFGWRKLSGNAEIMVDNGSELLSKVLPKTDCKFIITFNEDSIEIQNWHHDSPMGDERYTIKPIL